MTAILDIQQINNGLLPKFGQVFVGLVGTNPITNPITVFSDNDQTQALITPLSLDFNGRPLDPATGEVVTLYINTSYSIQWLDKDGNALLPDFVNVEITAGVSSVSAGTNLNDSGTVSAPIINLDSVITGVSIGDNLGIGTVTPVSPLHILENSTANGASAGATIEQTNASGFTLLHFKDTFASFTMGIEADDNIFYITPGLSLNTSLGLNIDRTTGFVSIGGTTGGSSNLNVFGSTRLIGNVGIGIAPTVNDRLLLSGSTQTNIFRTEQSVVNTIWRHDNIQAANIANTALVSNHLNITTTGLVEASRIETSFSDIGAATNNSTLDIYLRSNNVLASVVQFTGAGDVAATSFNGVALTTGGPATNFLDETGNYSAPTAGPGGATTEIQFNSSGSLAGISGFTTDGTTKIDSSIQYNSIFDDITELASTATGVTAPSNCVLKNKTLFIANAGDISSYDVSEPSDLHFVSLSDDLSAFAIQSYAAVPGSTTQTRVFSTGSNRPVNSKLTITGGFYAGTHLVVNTDDSGDFFDIAGAFIGNSSLTTFDTLMFGDYSAFRISGNHIFATTNFDDFIIYRIDNDTVVDVGCLMDAAEFDVLRDVEVYGNYAYVVSAGTTGIAVVDISDLTKPFIVQNIRIANRYFRTAINGHTLYATGVASGANNSLDSFDLSDPANPILLDSLTGLGQNQNAIEIRGNIAVLLAFTGSQVRTIDISNPSNLFVLDTIALTVSLPTNMAMWGRYVMVSTIGDPELEFLDISNPSLIVSLGTKDITPHTGPVNPFVAGNCLYMPTGTPDLVVWSLGDHDIFAQTVGSQEVENLTVNDKADFNSPVSMRSSVMVGGPANFLERVAIEGYLAATIPLQEIPIKSDTQMPLTLSADGVMRWLLVLGTKYVIFPGVELPKMEVPKFTNPFSPETIEFTAAVQGQPTIINGDSTPHIWGRNVGAILFRNITLEDKIPQSTKLFDLVGGTFVSSLVLKNSPLLNFKEIGNLVDVAMNNLDVILLNFERGITSRNTTAAFLSSFSNGRIANLTGVVTQSPALCFMGEQSTIGASVSNIQLAAGDSLICIDSEATGTVDLIGSSYDGVGDFFALPISVGISAFEDSSISIDSFSNSTINPGTHTFANFLSPTNLIIGQKFLVDGPAEYDGLHVVTAVTDDQLSVEFEIVFASAGGGFEKRTTVVTDADHGLVRDQTNTIAGAPNHNGTTNILEILFDDEFIIPVAFASGLGGGAVSATSKDEDSPGVFSFLNGKAANSSVTGEAILDTNALVTSIPAIGALVIINATTWVGDEEVRMSVGTDGVTEYTGTFPKARIKSDGNITFAPTAGNDKGLSSQFVRQDAARNTVTFTNGTNIVNETATLLVDGDTLTFNDNAGTLPAELRTDIIYFVVSATANTFQLSYTSGGAAITFTDDGSGTNTYAIAETHGSSPSSEISVNDPSTVVPQALEKLDPGDKTYPVVLQISGALTDIIVSRGYYRAFI
ncbi:MAG: hypothetical protein V3V84_07655 [Candidatus Bathyarchaeia archaeon]